MNKFEKIEKFVTEKVNASGKSKQEIYKILEEASEKFKCFIFVDFASESTKEFAGCHHFKVFNTRAGKVTNFIDFFNVRA